MKLHPSRSQKAAAIRPGGPQVGTRRGAFHAGLCAAAAFWIAMPACEPRIEEPLPPARSDPKPVRPDSSAPANNRCIRPTPAQPARTLARQGADPSCPPDDLKTPPKLRSGKVIFLDAKEHAVTVEVVERDDDRQRGLMYRKSMPEEQGMFFRFEERTNHTFWMHNTCIPLDMLFIDDDGLIVGIEENCPTMDDSTFQVGCPSRYVLELNAGWARRHGVSAGQRVRWEGF